MESEILKMMALGLPTQFAGNNRPKPRDLDEHVGQKSVYSNKQTTFLQNGSSINTKVGRDRGDTCKTRETNETDEDGDGDDVMEGDVSSKDEQEDENEEEKELNCEQEFMDYWDQVGYNLTKQLSDAETNIRISTDSSTSCSETTKIWEETWKRAYLMAKKMFLDRHLINCQLRSGPEQPTTSMGKPKLLPRKERKGKKKQDEGNQDFSVTNIPSIAATKKVKKPKVDKSKWGDQRITSHPQIKPGESVQKRYFYNRYKLFSRFDEGIELDDESWYSVTPEPIAKHIANNVATCSPDGGILIIDSFCGAGGNSIQFALISPSAYVIAIDIDPEKVRMARNNAKVYGVEDRIQFLVGDFMQLGPHLKRMRADVMFLSPPWGGPNYKKRSAFTMDQMTPDGHDIWMLAKQLCPRVAYFLPRSVDRTQVAEMGIGMNVCIEENMCDNKTKTVTAYFGFEPFTITNHQQEEDMSSVSVS